MHHQPYSKIPENLHGWNLDEAGHRQLSKVEWVVTEKVHGANFCILTDGDTVQFAKRKQVLGPEEDFFGHLLLKDELSQSARLAFAFLKKAGLAQLCIYGELLGGSYPHPEVPSDPRVEAVQTGVWYHPSLRFCCFDMALLGADGEVAFLGFDALVKACQSAELLCLPPLFRGNLTDAMQFPLGFVTGLPRFWGLPGLPDNLAEGVVIKPVEEIWVSGGKGLFRPVIKRKLPRFAEDERFHQAEAWTAQETRSGPTLVDDAFWEAEVAPLFTRSRLQSAISKVGRLSGRTRGRIAKELAQDVLAEVEARFPDIEPQGHAQLQERADRRAREMVR